MLNDLQILNLGIEMLVGILGAGHGISTHLLLSHLLCYLCGGYIVVSQATGVMMMVMMRIRDVPLLLPKMKL